MSFMQGMQLWAEKGQVSWNWIVLHSGVLPHGQRDEARREGPPDGQKRREDREPLHQPLLPRPCARSCCSGGLHVHGELAPMFLFRCGHESDPLLSEAESKFVTLCTFHTWGSRLSRYASVRLADVYTYYFVAWLISQISHPDGFGWKYTHLPKSRCCTGGLQVPSMQVYKISVLAF